MRSDRRGFFSIDAMFALTLLIIVSTSFLNVYEGRKLAAQQMGLALEGKQVGEKLAAAINTVYANRENFELYVELPENIEGYNYTITFDNVSQKISVENSIWGVSVSMVTCEDIEDFTLGLENFENDLRVYWADNQVKVVGT
jgi:hypothetical protein